MKCRYLTKDGVCTGRYSGYSCIRKHCALYQEALKCEFHDMSGDYCKKYARFGCVGKDSCETLANYLETVSEDGV